MGCRRPLDLAAAEGLDGVGSQRGACSTAGGSSVVELALTGLVDKAALVLGPARTALAGAVLPLHHLGAQRVALGPLPGPLQPPRLARLLQQRSPRGQRGGVVQGPGFAASRRQLPGRRDRESVRAVQMEGRAGTPHLSPHPPQGLVSAQRGAPNAILLGTSPSSKPPRRCLLCPRL